MEFSKKLLIVQLICSFILGAVTLIGWLQDRDISSMATLTASSFVTDGAWGGFYLWKSKNENRAKYAQQFVKQFADRYGVDAAIRLAEVVLKD